MQSSSPAHTALVPLRWPTTTAVAGGMIGEIGALGGGILPNVLGQSKLHTGSYRLGFILYAGLALAVLVTMRLVSRAWTRTWIGPGGRVVVPSTANGYRVETVALLSDEEAGELV